MVKKLISFVVLLTVFVSAISFAVVAEAESENLIINGDFEGETIAPTKAANATVELTTQEKYEGKQSIKITKPVNNDSMFVYNELEQIQKNGSGVYEASCWVKVVFPENAINAPSDKKAKLMMVLAPVWTVESNINGSYPYRKWIGGNKVDVGNEWVRISVKTTLDEIYKLQPLTNFQISIKQDPDQYKQFNDFEIYVDNLELRKISSVEDTSNKNLPAPQIPAKNTDGSVTHADGKVYVNDPNLVYTGRWNTEYNTVYYSGWQGYVDIKFTGTKTLKAMGTYASDVFGSEVYIDIFDEQGKSILPVKNTNLGEVGRYLYMTEGSDLTFGEVTLDVSKVYTLRIIARWDTNRALFQGIYMDAGARTLPIADTPYIEFIGDSISAGYIDTPHSTATMQDKSWTDSYSYRTAQLLGWRSSAVARSGSAIATSPELMPVKYKWFVCNNSNIAADYSKQNLDYIVVNLGTNDSGLAKSESGRATFKTEYRKFIEYLLEIHPKAIIFVMEPYSNETEYKFGDEIKALADEFDRVEYIATTGWDLHKQSSKVNEYLTAGDLVHLLPAGADHAAQKLASVLEEYHNTRHKVNISVNTTGELDETAVSVLADGEEVETFVDNDTISFYVNKNSQVDIKFNSFGNDEYIPVAIKYTGNKGQILGVDEYSFVARGTVTELTVDYALAENSQVVKLFYVDGSGKQVIFDSFNVGVDAIERLNNYPTLYKKEFKEFKIDQSIYNTTSKVLTAIKSMSESEIFVEVVYKVADESIQTGYTVAVNEFMTVTDDNGNVISGAVSPFSLVTFTAEETDGSANFAYWIDKNENIISYNQVYTRYITGNVDIKPVYTTAPLEKAAISLTIVDNNQKLVVIAERSLDSKLKILEHGILISEYETDSLTIEDVGSNKNGKVYLGHRVNDQGSVFNNGTYILTKGNKHSGGGTYSERLTTLYCVAFVRYEDAEGNEQIKYSAIAQSNVRGPIEIPDIEFDEID